MLNTPAELATFGMFLYELRDRQLWALDTTARCACRHRRCAYVFGVARQPHAMAASTFTAPPAGRFATEPSLDDFEAIAAKAFRQLPQKFRALCEDLVIRVEDFLHRMKAKSKFQILGPFQGVGDLAVSAADPCLLERAPILHCLND
jgi:hypothetical protein